MPPTLARNEAVDQFTQFEQGTPQAREVQDHWLYFVVDVSLRIGYIGGTTDVRGRQRRHLYETRKYFRGLEWVRYNSVFEVLQCGENRWGGRLRFILLSKTYCSGAYHRRAESAAQCTFASIIVGGAPYTELLTVPPAAGLVRSTVVAVKGPISQGGFVVILTNRRQESSDYDVSTGRNGGVRGSSAFCHVCACAYPSTSSSAYRDGVRRTRNRTVIDEHRLGETHRSHRLLLAIRPSLDHLSHRPPPKWSGEPSEWGPRAEASYNSFHLAAQGMLQGVDAETTKRLFAWHWCAEHLWRVVRMYETEIWHGAALDLYKLPRALRVVMAEIVRDSGI